ncbi:MAG: phosphate ABC transporter permease subunit PstC [Actinobacteria bacterium]|nr:phosphate ABC transporter permease subunit PstC [Actinomycetota bacterium]
MAVVGIILIFTFVISAGLPLFFKVGPYRFLFGMEWRPTGGQFGILPLILGTLLVVAGALVVGGSAGVVTAIFLSELCPQVLKRTFKVVVELLAGIPSVVYGFFGIIVLIPFIRSQVGGSGYGILSASIILGIMILPTVTAIAEDAVSSVPIDYKLAGLSLGATDWQTIRQVILPAATGGIATALVLGIGRAIGETMAVLMVIGNAPQIPDSLVKPVSALTSTIALDMAYASGDHRTALFAIAIVLLLIITLLLISIRLLHARLGSAE